MGMLARLMGKVTGTVRPAERGHHRTHATGDRNVGGRQESATPVPPELPLDDDGTDARNIGG